MTLVDASASASVSALVKSSFCIDNEATEEINNQYLTWQEANDFCVAAGKFLLNFEQHVAGAAFTDPLTLATVERSGNWEWVLQSNDDDIGRQVVRFLESVFQYNDDDIPGQAAGFFLSSSRWYAYHIPYTYYHENPSEIDGNIAFRCGKFPLLGF
jgi:hypothetical protein